MNALHKAVLNDIRAVAGSPVKEDWLQSYLGHRHPYYPMRTPELREIARAFLAGHRELGPTEFAGLLSSLVSGKTYTEKAMAGILLNSARPAQWEFPIRLLDQWLDHVEGWAEVDVLCTGKYSRRVLPAALRQWQPLLKKFSRSRNISKRRAALVLFCSPVSHCTDPELARAALAVVDELKGEKDILITKAVSWVLRSMTRHHRTAVEEYVGDNRDSLPRIAVRETEVKLDTGKKTR